MTAMTTGYVLNFLKDLPNKAKEGDIFYVDESKYYFSMPVCYIWENGEWHIEYIT
ncbi:hypothetical protein [Brevibacillus gelatini]|uniref:hypothetical protein n=1 Tax=Brevibacillus gelatini TaxID=1655277 RepID=UPI0014728685|nr:hypothetical protein [Brevibacillus gelatini]